ncbi:MAG: DUF6279 family lipoprotein [Gammaproteobacteria bacterium]
MHQALPPTGTVPSRSWSRLRLAVAGLLAATLVGGCVIRVVYNQLDWLLLWYVEDYVDLDAAQEQQAKLLIARTLDWHRASQLPRYAMLTRELLSRAESGLDATFLGDQYAEIVQLWDELLVRTSPGIAAVLQTLSDQQVAELSAALARKNRELEQDYSGRNGAERRAKQDKVIVRMFRRFTGRLTPEQEALVRRHTAGFHDLSTDWLQRRGAWQQAFRSLLASRQANPDFVAGFAELALNPNQFDTPRYRALVADNQRRSLAMTVAVLESLTPAQMQQLRKNLTTYAGDFETLARDAREK